MREQADREKFQYLPTAENGFLLLGKSEEGGWTVLEESGPSPAPEPEPEEPAGIYPCPCCGFLTFPVPKEEALAYICPVCFWENDLFDPGEDDPSDENRGMTLRQGRENFKRYGAVRPDLVQYVRPFRRKGRNERSD